MERFGTIATEVVRKIKEDEARFEEQERIDAFRRSRGMPGMFDETPPFEDEGGCFAEDGVCGGLAEEGWVRVDG